ncbi:MAG: tol-pal system protein YbgF [Thermodesulfobacteriota bacterium]
MKILCTRTSFFVALGLLPLLSGCVTDQDFRGLQLQLRNLDNRMVEMERELNHLRSNAGSSVEVMRKQQAGMGSTIDRLNSEMMQIKGQLDESRHRYRSLQEENQKLQEEITQLQKKTEAQVGAQRMSVVEPGANEIDARLSSVQTNQAAMEEEKAREAALAAELARKEAELVQNTGQPREISAEKSKKVPGSAESAAVVPAADTRTATAIQPNQSSGKPQTKTSGNTMYDEGLELFKAKKYKEAQKVFTEFAQKHPKDELAISARFWIGDCLFNQDEFAMAILEYQNVIADYPNHAKAPAALFKQGMAFEKLQDIETARIVYNKILSEYPNSDQVEPASSRLKKLEE